MRSFTALINPVSGRGNARTRWEAVARLLREAGAAVRAEQTRSREHAIALAAGAARRGDVVVAAGGDGLVRDAAGGVVAAGGTLAIVPAGRGNDLARALGIPHDPAALAKLLAGAPARAIDVLDAGGVIVPGNVYTGIDAMATRIINASRRMPALLAYRLAPLRAAAAWHAAGFTVTADGRSRHVRAHSVVIANSGAYGHGLRIVPPAAVDDGLCDVMVIGDGPRRAIVTFMAEVKAGTHTRRPDVDLRTARVVIIDADRPVPVCADGDEIVQLPVTIRLRKGALSVIAPA
ncbi:MAG TPA: diacylglycerol kinase family protein [Streptosporangiaceae bacterium]|nr:diacylglycerol kinase family protein [Streptosporangiaceae bacterium]